MKTEITINLESEDEKALQASGKIICNSLREMVRMFNALTGDSMKAQIMHDGIDVTESVH